MRPAFPQKLGVLGSRQEADSRGPGKGKISPAGTLSPLSLLLKVWSAGKRQPRNGIRLLGIVAHGGLQEGSRYHGPA